MRRLAASGILLALAALAVVACGTEPTLPPEPVVASVQLAATDTVLLLGDTVQLAATVQDEGGSPLTGVAVEWSTSDTSRMRVDADGLVTVVGRGPAVITARAGSVAGSVLLRGVRAIYRFTINLLPDMQAVGTTRQLVVEAFDSANRVIPDPQLVFTSTDPAVVTIDDSGLLRALSLGRTTLTARVENQSRQVMMEVVTGFEVATVVNTLGGEESRAFGVNDRADVVGDAQTAGGQWHAFLVRDGAMVDVGPPGVTSRAVAVNAEGTVVGNVYTSTDTTSGVRPFVWRDGTATYLPVPSGAASAYATDINDTGTIVGYATSPCPVCGTNRAGSALRWDDGVLTDLGRLGGHQALAMAIDNQGRIAGGVEPDWRGGWIENGAFVYLVPGIVMAASDNGYLASTAPGEHFHIWHDGTDHLVYVGHRSSAKVHGVDRQGQVVATKFDCYAPGPCRVEEVIRLANDRLFGLNNILASVTTWRVEGTTEMSNDGKIAGYGRESPGAPLRGVVFRPRS